MKNFIDRFAYTNHRPVFFKQRVMLVANGGVGLDKVLEAMRYALGGAEIVHEVDVTTPPWPPSERLKKKNEKKITEAANKFYRLINTGEPPAPSFTNYMRFYFYKKISPEVKDYLPADYEFYRHKGEYYYDTRVGVGMKIKAMIISKIITFFMRDFGPEKKK